VSQDVVENNDINLSEEFKLSIVNDVVNGVAYMHSSAKLAHGALTLHSCIVTPQWTVRLSNYGLNGVMHDSSNVSLLQIPRQNIHGTRAL